MVTRNESPYLPRRATAAFIDFASTGLGLIVVIGSLFLLGGVDSERMRVVLEASIALAGQVGWVLTAHLTALLALYISAIAGQVGDRRRVVALFAELLAATTFPLLALLAIRVKEAEGAVALVVSLFVSVIVWFLAAQLGTLGTPPAADHLAQLQARVTTLTARIERLGGRARRAAWAVLVVNVGATMAVVLTALVLTYPEAAADVVVLSWFVPGAALTVILTWVSNVLYYRAADHYMKVTAFIPAAAVHASLMLLIGIGISHWSNLYPFVLAIIGGQLFVILSGTMAWAGWSARDGAARAAAWLSRRERAQARSDIQKLESMLALKVPRSRWQRALSALLSGE